MKNRKILNSRVTRRQAIKASGIAALGLAFSKPVIDTIRPASVWAQVSPGIPNTIPTPVVSSWKEVAKLLASDGISEDEFGFSVGIDGNRVVVGAHINEVNAPYSGAAYIYDWNAFSWNETKLAASDGAIGDHFGYSVSIRGDRVVVGAFGVNDHGPNSGAAYVYDWDGDSWNETKLTASDASAGDFYGWSVALSEGRIVVGAYNNDDHGPNSGAAYVYDWDGDSWNETKLTASDASAGDFFGYSVALDKDRVAIGAINSENSGLNSGAGYIFHWNGKAWVETSKIAPSDGAANDNFAVAVDISGDRAVVGSWFDEDKGPNSGSAYVFEWDGKAWNETTKITPSDLAAHDNFAFSVALHGNMAVMGAHDNDDHGFNSGSIYVFQWDESGWSETKLTASDASGDDFFGFAVAIHNDRIIVGALGDDDNGLDSGSAYIFEFA